MFVFRLDRPWLGTPFLMQGFMVQSAVEVQQLRDLCEYVFVDTRKSLLQINNSQTTAKLFGRHKEKQSSIQFPPNINKSLARAGLRNALPVYSRTMKSLRQCFQNYSQNFLVDAAAIERQVDICLETLIKNTTAMGWLARVKSHNSYTNEHSMHVSLLAMVFATHCGWTRQEAQKAGIAGLLFDLGKIKIPANILTKPGPLSEQEWQLVHEHPNWGRYFLEKSGFDQDVINAAYYHHERPDGKGYPVKRLGNQISKIARLIHILDAYDAMISYRPYAQQRTILEATRVLYRGRGHEFDAEMVDQFIEMLGTYPVGTIVELSTGEVAVIIGQNNDARLLPTVAVLRDRNKNRVDEKIVNLRDVAANSGYPGLRIKTMLHDGSYGLFMQDYTRTMMVS